MNRLIKTLVGASIVLMAASSAVWAGTAPVPLPGAGFIVYSPNVQQAVPTLSGWTLIVLGILFGIIAFRVMRQKQHGRTLASLTAASIIAVGASSGVKLIDEAHAAVMAIPLDITVGSQATFEDGEQQFTNTTNVIQVIRSITYDTTENCRPHPTITPPDPQCSNNLPIQPQGSCWLFTLCDRNK